ncbi:GntR family transcriptional regulator [Streptomyces sp. DSM 44915]|uniref:GntR family transcriptional regulator n=1 Tax=Streptomyces chisholmiae TaxID=3075540 RepID=A0ABU2JYG6_9ACTN|nr:GntR family transcriptional regulator [Streptomyces sp. DSM 44915]MDT0270042.1 GntR family transcriptional regulator [Streptomyces sp. DSM 44915]
MAKEQRATSNPRGTYMLVADMIRREITSSESMTELPPVSELMARHGVSRTLLTRALKLLSSEGLVTSEQGGRWRVVRDGEDSRPLRERLLDVFETDKLGVGDAFPSEAELCQRFGRSRTAVRSALDKLEGAGLLRRSPGKPRVVVALPEKTTEVRG